MMHDETLWDRREEFNPDRFYDTESRGLQLSGFSSTGGKTCPGKSMALTAAKIFVAEVFRRFSFALPRADYSVKKNFVFVIVPKSPSNS
jgi:cytochrome P450